MEQHIVSAISWLQQISIDQMMPDDGCFLLEQRAWHNFL